MISPRGGKFLGYAQKVFPLDVGQMVLFFLVVTFGVALGAQSPTLGFVFPAVFFLAFSLGPVIKRFERTPRLRPSATAPDHNRKIPSENPNQKIPEGDLKPLGPKELSRFVEATLESQKTSVSGRAVGTDLSLTVVVPVYNGADTLVHAIKSVTDWQSSQLQLIVVDDGSIDATPDLLSDFMSGSAGRTRFFRQENRGLSAARNLGLQNVDTDYVVFLDADDWFLPNFAKETLAEIKEAGTDAAVFRMLDFREGSRSFVETTYSSVAKSSKDLVCSESASEVLTLTNPQVSNKVFSMDLIERAGFAFPEDREIIDDLPTVYPWLAYANSILVTKALRFVYRRKPYGLHKERLAAAGPLLGSLVLLRKRLDGTLKGINEIEWDSFVRGKLEWGIQTGGTRFRDEILRLPATHDWVKKLALSLEQWQSNLARIGLK